MNKPRTGKFLCLAVVACLVLGAADARADVFTKQKKRTNAFQIMGQNQPAKDATVITWFNKSMSRTYNGDGTSALFLADKKTLYMIDDNKRQYAEIPLDFDLMMQEMVSENPEAAEVMAKMPGFIKNMMGNMSAKVTETDETKMINGWKCRKYLVEINMGMAGTAAGENWVTQDLKIDYAMMFAAENAAMAAMPGFENILEEMKKLQGVVVSSIAKTTVVGSSESRSTTELLEAGEKDAPGGTYDLPAGYTKVKLQRLI